MTVPRIRSLDGANASRTADETVAQWRGIEAALAPIVGSQGVAALYRRSLFIAAKTHPWLTLEQGIEAPALDLEVLRAVLSTGDATDTAAGAALLMQTFLRLLTSLIGASLAERLLGPLRLPFSSGSSAQDISP